MKPYSKIITLLMACTSCGVYASGEKEESAEIMTYARLGASGSFVENSPDAPLPYSSLRNLYFQDDVSHSAWLVVDEKEKEVPLKEASSLTLGDDSSEGDEPKEKEDVETLKREAFEELEKKNEEMRACLRQMLAQKLIIEEQLKKAKEDREESLNQSRMHQEESETLKRQAIGLSVQYGELETQLREEQTRKAQIEEALAKQAEEFDVQRRELKAEVHEEEARSAAVLARQLEEFAVQRRGLEERVREEEVRSAAVLARQIEESAAQRREYEAQLEGQRAANLALTQQVQAHGEQVAALQRDLASARQDVVNVRGQVASLTAQLQAAQRATAAAQAQVPPKCTIRLRNGKTGTVYLTQQSLDVFRSLINTTGIGFTFN